MFVKCKDWTEQEVYINLDQVRRVELRQTSIRIWTGMDAYTIENKAEIKRVEKYIKDGRKEQRTEINR